MKTNLSRFARLGGERIVHILEWIGAKKEFRHEKYSKKKKIISKV